MHSHNRCRQHLLASCHPTTMTAITQNLPWFISDLGISIIGQVSAFSLKSSVSIALNILFRNVTPRWSRTSMSETLIVSNTRSPRAWALVSWWEVLS